MTNFLLGCIVLMLACIVWSPSGVFTIIGLLLILFIIVYLFVRSIKYLKDGY